MLSQLLRSLRDSNARLGALLLGWVLLVLPASAWARSFDFHDSSWDGAEALVRLAQEELGASHVVTSNELDWASLTPRDALLILHPEVTLDSNSLAAFLRAGGRVALLDDFGAGDELLRRFGLGRGPPPASPARMLRDNPNLPIAEPAHEVKEGGADVVHPIVAQVPFVILNHPTSLTHKGLSQVLVVRGSDGSETPVAIAGQVGRGRIFAASDPSVFINEMLRYEGNRALARGLLTYLLEDDSWGPRQGKLVIVANGLTASHSFGEESETSQEVHQAMQNAETFLHDARVKGLPDTLFKVLSLAVALLLGGWIQGYAARPLKPSTPRFARSRPLASLGGVTGRAALLMAPGTHRGLVLLEQKQLLEDTLSAWLGAPSMTLGEAVETLEAQGLMDEELGRLLQLVRLDISRAETALLARASFRVTLEQLERTERLISLVATKAHLRPSSPLSAPMSASLSSATNRIHQA